MQIYYNLNELERLIDFLERELSVAYNIKTLLFELLENIENIENLTVLKVMEQIDFIEKEIFILHERKKLLLETYNSFCEAKRISNDRITESIYSLNSLTNS